MEPLSLEAHRSVGGDDGRGAAHADVPPAILLIHYESGLLFSWDGEFCSGWYYHTTFVFFQSFLFKQVRQE